MEAISVSQLNQRVKSVLETAPLLNGFTVEGEISNFKKNASGHYYFTLKDALASVSCVMFRYAAQKCKIQPQNGMHVVISGHVSLYTVSGSYQFYADSLKELGSGNLNEQYKALWDKLNQEGIFDKSHKKAVPRYPKIIALITSDSGAAVMDMLRILRRRWPMAAVRLFPVQVQGEKAAAQLCGAIRYVNKWKLADLIICGRGGGSIEDLWCFNDEKLARVIFESSVPYISAVGHEPDYTIADYAADLRAATPSNGAELAAPDAKDEWQHLDDLQSKLYHCMVNRLSLCERQVSFYKNKHVLTSPANLIADRTNQLNTYKLRFQTVTEKYLDSYNYRLQSLASQLDALSPLKVLSRGFSFTQDKNGKILKSVKEISTGEEVLIIMDDGSLNCIVNEIKENKYDL